MPIAPRLNALQKTSIAAITILWAVCFALSFRTAWLDVGNPGIFMKAAEEPDGYPTFIGYRVYIDGAASSLQPGDTLIELGGIDLRGLGPIAATAQGQSVARGDTPLAVMFDRDGTRGTTQVPVTALRRMIVPWLPVSLSFMAVCLLGAVRIRPTPGALAMFNAGACVAVVFASTMGGSPMVVRIFLASFGASIALLPPLVLRAIAMFPHDDVPLNPWIRWAPWLAAPVIGAINISVIFSVPLGPDLGNALVAPSIGAMIVAIIWIATHNYRRADAVGRRQMRWVIYGLYFVGAPVVAATLLVVLFPRFGLETMAAMALVAFFPVFVLIAIARHNLFDIDRLISATASYNFVVIALVGIGIAVVPRVANAASTVLGIDATTASTAIALVAAAIVVPTQRRLRPRLEKVFFAERHALAQGIDALLAELSAPQPPEQLLRVAGERLDELLRPEVCSLFAHAGDVYAPVFARGNAIPAGFEADSPLVHVLEKRITPLAADTLQREGVELSPFDRAALESLGVPVVVPIHHGESLFAFLCVGPKRSGDVYTATDLSLLAAVGDKLSSAVARYDESETLQRAEDMQRALRSYVPGAVVEQLETGREVAATEREVTVLFVDLRGYTQFSEDKRPDEIFSTLNLYTESVSGVVGRHAGHIVEFNGDGMMAVFGAIADAGPTPVPKEESAVAAGREIVAAVADVARRIGEPLTVGVGIASGTAFVGSIRSADRLLWTAVGNTTNLASRLQSLTRDLGAAIVIDGTTWERCGEAAAKFEGREGVAVRGRSDRHDLYLIPLDTSDLPAA